MYGFIGSMFFFFFQSDLWLSGIVGNVGNMFWKGRSWKKLIFLALSCQFDQNYRSPAYLPPSLGLLPPSFIHFLLPPPFVTLCLLHTAPPLSLTPLSLSLTPSFNVLFKSCRPRSFHPSVLSSPSSPHSLPCFIIHLSSPSLSLPLRNGFIISPLLPSVSPSPAALSNSFTSHSLYLSFLLSSPSNAFSFFRSTSLFPPNIPPSLFLSLSLYLRYWSYKDRCSKESRTSKSVLYASWRRSLNAEREEKKPASVISNSQHLSALKILPRVDENRA